MNHSRKSRWRSLAVATGAALVAFGLGASSLSAAPRPQATEKEGTTVERVAKGTTSTDKKTKLTTQKQTDKVVTTKVEKTKGNVASASTKSSTSTIWSMHSPGRTLSSWPCRSHQKPKA